uniref:Uncharacterized protein n=1 Tax=viral metagenome TaxID=1070528 RepID=A0A6C0F600_9ZZZZ|tara:strand:+ start:2592 stop:2774 length:183 start_codon:yes stop_codon:yes gene_type:complete
MTKPDETFANQFPKINRPNSLIIKENKPQIYTPLQGSYNNIAYLNSHTRSTYEEVVKNNT